MSKTRLYTIYVNMLTRCLNKNTKNYSRYGGRGIAVCDDWVMSFENFYRDMGDDNLKTLDRIDNDKGYSKDNCRWATRKQQANNTRMSRIIEHDGKALSVAEWNSFLGFKKNTIWQRLNRGWSIQESLRK